MREVRAARLFPLLTDNIIVFKGLAKRSQHFNATSCNIVV